MGTVAEPTPTNEKKGVETVARLSLARWFAHLFGWHLNSCRGDYRRCWSPKMRVARNGWWRNLPGSVSDHG